MEKAVTEGKGSKKIKPPKKPVVSKRVTPQIVYVSDPYLPSREAVWKDAVSHEQNLDKMWNFMWKAAMLDPKMLEGHQKMLIQKKYKMTMPKLPSDESVKAKFYDTSTKSATLPPQDSPTLHLEKSLNKTKSPIPKVRLVSEQYGIYRKLKYFSQPTMKEEAPLPTSKQVHVVKPLLC